MDLRTATPFGNEHFSEGGLPVLDIPQADSPHDIVSLFGDPEVSRARLIKRWDRPEVRLVLCGYRNIEFLPLNTQNEFEHRLLMFRVKPAYPHVFCNAP